mmetsp:Transcript_28387/g.76898  ORF Transcript_28387/g.76898 Transcript_28387/m.76898 type:complete len:326 (-) Transcript_28387:51-1028(-)|eukprot:CAMPEP_0172367748 /NCGR_PEP_ID=MMETSP1060-20121228/23392_1 /TAXON_ID=37318 /ORGANISM="Pseudo-nitzschia pungens, Strain cf. cingulata" /LENGTH=325 /DNA_ID=CAMNT_0013092099 /DNA_START=122 /DNA_END=1099 /DNA_ORIENTATION=-
MSAGYASRLSEYPNKGTVGLPEIHDTRRSLSVKIKHLVKAVKASEYTVVLTGAGISTASGIPDFRGPNGIWTKEKQKMRPEKTTKKSASSNRKRKLSETKSASPSAEKQNDDMFALAKPSLTHRAITQLVLDGKIKYCVTQNVDGLHRRSGLSRNHHSTVHGCIFTEKCADCGCEYFRDKELGGLSFKPTGNRCDECADGGDMRDTLLDWEDPVLDMELVHAECVKADLILCLGTSLRIEPVGSLPLLAKKFVIVNLQETPIDEDAAHIIRARVDDVMESLMDSLGHDNSWKDGSLHSVERKWKPNKKQNEDWACLIKEYPKSSK